MSMLMDDINEELQHHQKMLKALRQRLHELELQAARFGYAVDPHIPSEIDVLKQQIAVHTQEITQLQLRIKRATAVREESPEPTPTPPRNRHYFRFIGAIALFVGICLPASLFVAPKLLNSSGSRIQHNLPKTEDSTRSASTDDENSSSPSLEPTSVVNNQTVEDTINSYYQALSNHKFGDAWSLLTPAYRQRHNSDGYQAYANYWDNEDKLNVDSLRVMQQDDTNALAEIQVTYSNPNRTTKFRIALIRDKGRWFFDRYCEVGGQPRCSDTGMDGS